MDSQLVGGCRLPIAQPYTSQQQHSDTPALQHRRQRHGVCRALDPLVTLASTDPSALQDVIVGGAITAAVGAALFSGLKREPVPCDLCAGNGGIRCFACQGDGSMDLPDGEISINSSIPGKRGIGSQRNGNPKACKVCKGTGLVLCSRCKGSGYISKF